MILYGFLRARVKVCNLILYSFQDVYGECQYGVCAYTHINTEEKPLFP